jgi:DNA-binding Lrp family transcriptional regulator
MSDGPLDDVDRAILYYLQEDGRRAITEIADAVDISDNTVRNRIRGMEEAGVISGVHDGRELRHRGYPAPLPVRLFGARQGPGRSRRGRPPTRRGHGGHHAHDGTHNVYVSGAAPEKDGMTELAYAIDELGLDIEREHLVRDRVRQPDDDFHPPPYVS